MKKLFSFLVGLIAFVGAAQAQQQLVITTNNQTITIPVWEVNSITFSPITPVEAEKIPQAVDLGLSVKWASFNYGATSETEPGYYIGWGDASGRNTSMNLNYFPSSTPASTIVSSKYDIVHNDWGLDWRMPSDKEIEELLTKCRWTLDTEKGGYTVSGNGNSIFIPFGGYREGEEMLTVSEKGYYWSGILSDTDANKATALVVDEKTYISSAVTRFIGSMIRPVYGEYLEGAVVSSVSAEDVMSKTANIVVKYAGDLESVTEYGVCYNTSAEDLAKEYAGVKSVTATELREDGSCIFSLSDLEPNTTYYFRAYLMYKGNIIYDDANTFTTQTKFPVAEAVDLGLSVKWSSWNMGATKESEVGEYMAWGDPTGENASYVNADYPDNISSLNSELGKQYNVAVKQWGDKWRMPTESEWLEFDALEKEIVTIDGVKGLRIQGKVLANGDQNTIFIPFAGYQTRTRMNAVDSKAYYWSAENNTVDFAKYCDVGKVSSRIATQGEKGGLHLTVRPVYDDSNNGGSSEEEGDTLTEAGKAARSVDLGLSVKWATYNIGATTQDGEGDRFAWGETETKDEYTRTASRFYDTGVSDIRLTAGEDYFVSNLATAEIYGTDKDAAHVLWGGTWRMPTELEFNELLNQCTWSRSGNGYTVTGPNGNSIYLPYASIQNGTQFIYDGSCNYWTSTWDRSRTNSSFEDERDYSFSRYFTTNGSRSVSSSYLYRGLVIRAVQP